MKGLKKIALASAIAAVAAGAQAELKALDDSTMSEMTGQAGLTIDLETKWTIGEFAYQDAGFLVLRGLSMGGNSNNVAGGIANSSMLDNIRMEIDVAGSGVDGAGNPTGDNILKYGMSNVQNLAAISLALGAKAGADAALYGKAAASAGQFRQEVAPGVTIGNAANAGSFFDDGVNEYRVDDMVAYGDGDLKIHLTFTDAWQKGGGFAAFSPAAAGGQNLDGTATGLTFQTLSFEDAVEIATHAVDFEFGIEQIGLASSAYDVGNQGLEATDHTTGVDTDTSTTVLISDLSIKGYLGPADIHIENKGNGFGADGSGIGGVPGTGNADSKIHWDSFFKVTDLDVYIDIAGVKIEDLKIHNVRGDTSSLNQVVQRDASGAAVLDASGNVQYVNTASFGFAHSKRDIFAVKDAVLNLANLAAGGSAYVDGIAINTRFKGDIDIGHLSFGNTGTSIGQIFITDKTATTNWTISAH